MPEVSQCDARLEGFETKIVKAITKKIIPLVANKNTYEETWRLKISKIDDGNFGENLLTIN